MKDLLDVYSNRIKDTLCRLRMQAQAVGSERPSSPSNESAGYGSESSQTSGGFRDGFQAVFDRPPEIQANELPFK